MCWSIEVTVGFVVVEALCAAILLKRGQRLTTLALLPLLAQECGQLALWFAVEADERAAPPSSSCSAANARLTAVQWLLVGWLLPVLPACAGYVALVRHQQRVRRALAMVGETDRIAAEVRESFRQYVMRQRQDRGILLLMPLAATTLVSASMAVWALGAHFGWPLATWCTVRGAHGGHQLWPWVQPPLPPVVAHFFKRAGGLMAEVCACWWLGWLPHWLPHGLRACAGWKDSLAKVLALAFAYIPVWTIYIGTAAYGITVAALRGDVVSGDREHARGWLGGMMVAACGPAIIVPAYLLWGAEYGSFWCWSASVAFVISVFEPQIVAWAARGYNEARRVGFDPFLPANWLFVIKMTALPRTRVLDWRENGPLYKASKGTCGPFDNHPGLKLTFDVDELRNDVGGSTPPTLRAYVRLLFTDSRYIALLLDDVGRWAEANPRLEGACQAGGDLTNESLETDGSESDSALA